MTNDVMPASSLSAHDGVTVPSVVEIHISARGTGSLSADRATAFTLIF
jgi:hypothetical protein